VRRAHYYDYLANCGKDSATAGRIKAKIAVSQNTQEYLGLYTFPSRNALHAKVPKKKTTDYRKTEIARADNAPAHPAFSI
jgi:hypothetical protein